MGKGEHDGHRERMRQRFANSGLENFQPHEVLELLLFYAIPRANTNETAHKLIDEFGGLAGVFNAPIAELMQVEGVGERAAVLIKLIPAVARRYASALTANEEIINCIEDAGRYLLPRFYGLTEETSFVLCMDAKGKVLGTDRLAEGDMSSAMVTARQIAAKAMKHNASAVCLAHNHPNGVAVPSEQDVSVTIRMREILAGLGIIVLDHLVVADGDYVSMVQSGFIKPSEMKFSY